MWLNVRMQRGRTDVLPCPEAGALARDVVAQGVAPHAAVGYFGVTGPARVGGHDEGIFDLASLTKPMTAVGCVMAGLDRRAPLVSYLPELHDTPAAEVPLELFLAHRAGVPAHISLFHPLLEGRAVELGDALRTAACSRISGASPAEEHAPVYSDVGYLLAGAALARATGARDAGEAIERLVVAPLGLEKSLGTARRLREVTDFDARVVPTEVVAFRGGEVRGAVHDENAWAVSGDGGSGHAGMFGTVSAVLTFARHTLRLRDEAPWLFFPRKSGSLLAGFDGKSPEGSSAGTVLGPSTYGHLGFTGTSFWVDPDTQVGVALLTNRVSPTRENTAIRRARPEVHDALAKLAMGALPGAP